MANKRLHAALAAVLVVMPVGAASAASYLDEMQTLDAQIALINKRNELQTALKGSAMSLSLPMVSSIIEDKNGRVAKVVYENGLVRWVKVGDVIAHGVTVRSINAGGVVASMRKKPVPLRFFTEAKSEADSITVTGDAPRINVPPLPKPGPLVVPVAPAPDAAAPAGASVPAA